MNNYIRSIAAFTAFQMLVGCIPDPFLHATPEKIAKATVIEKSKFDSGTSVAGPAIVINGSNNPLTGMDWWQQRLVSTKGRAATITSLLVTIHYTTPDWRFYETASFVGGESEPVQVVSRDVENCFGGDCSYRESVGVNLSTVLLEQAKLNGLEIRLNSRKGHATIISMPASYIQGFASALDSAPP